MAPPRKPWNKQDQWFHQPCKADARYKLDCHFYSDDFHEVAVHFVPCCTNWGRDTASHRRRRKSQFGEALRCIDNHLQSRRSPLNLNYIKLWGVRRFPPPRTIIQRIFDEEVHSFFFLSLAPILQAGITVALPPCNLMKINSRRWKTRAVRELELRPAPLMHADPWAWMRVWRLIATRCSSSQLC